MQVAGPVLYLVAAALYPRLMPVDVFALTRQLIDVESITGNERAVGDVLFNQLSALGYKTLRMPVEEDRFNVWATSPDHAHPKVVFSTHMDVVPPWIPSSEDDAKIYGRGACDAKGIIAAQIAAAERLHAKEIHPGLLFVVGEERDSQGAYVANQHAPGSKFLINGEPTDNRIGVASKGALRVNVIAEGKMAHSAYPELGDSAIEKLLSALERLRKIELPNNPKVGPCTVNIGMIEGGRAPNVIPDKASAQLLYRLVGPSDQLRRDIERAVAPDCSCEYALEIPFVKLRTVPGIPIMTAKFTTDIPRLSNWGDPVLLGPGSIHVAHTPREFIDKNELLEAIDLYVKVAEFLNQQ
ncbi:MAG TPA: M20/M25/M40 family metallo-hydrolase [Candidatus Koribacter sp.]|jgi:acetylornithine deacetylase